MQAPAGKSSPVSQRWRGGGGEGEGVHLTHGTERECGFRPQFRRQASILDNTPSPPPPPLSAPLLPSPPQLLYSRICWWSEETTSHSTAQFSQLFSVTFTMIACSVASRAAFLGCLRQRSEQAIYVIRSQVPFCGITISRFYAAFFVKVSYVSC